MDLKIISRVILTNSGKIILVKNLGKNYWSLPGGHWEWSMETLSECAQRELLEETGYKIIIDELLFVQEFESKSSKIVEFIWGASLETEQDDVELENHRDSDIESEIEQVKWFSFDELGKISVRPNVVKSLVMGESVSRYIKS